MKPLLCANNDGNMPVAVKSRGGYRLTITHQGVDSSEYKARGVYRLGGGTLKLAAIVILIIETILSHTPGERSSEESGWLSRTTGVDEAFLRGSAHVGLFFTLALFAGFGFGWTGIGCTALWSILDEATKISAL